MTKYIPRYENLYKKWYEYSRFHLNCALILNIYMKRQNFNGVCCLFTSVYDFRVEICCHNVAFAFGSFHQQ